MIRKLALCSLLLSGVALGQVSLARADGYEECNQILVQDIFNRTSRLDTSKTVSKSLRAASFFSSSESEAYARYEKDYREAQSKGLKIDAEFHYGVIGGELGVALGLGAAVGLTRYLEGLLFRVQPVEPLVFATVVLVLVLVALGACLVPAGRATATDPLATIRAH